MSEKEKRDFYIAMCRCCLIAQAMKSCAVCRFKIGLAEQVKLGEPRQLPIPVQILIFAISEHSEFKTFQHDFEETDKLKSMWLDSDQKADPYFQYKGLGTL